MLAVLHEPSSTTLATVTAWNPSSHRRQAILTTTIPCAQGTVPYYTPPELKASNTAWPDGDPHVAAVSFGFPWSDTTTRFLRVTFPVVLQGNERRTITIATGQGVRPSGAFAVGARLAAFRASPDYSLYLNGEWRNILSQQGTVIEENAWLRCERWRTRYANSPFWSETHIEWLHGMEHCHFWTQYGNSDFTYPTVNYTLTSEVWFYANAHPQMRFRRAKELARTRNPSGTAYTLIHLGGPPSGESQFPDGCSQLIHGTVSGLPSPAYTAGTIEGDTYLAEMDDSPDFGVQCMADNWPESGAAGIFGAVPPLPSWFASESAATDALEVRATELQQQLPPATNSGPHSPWAKGLHGCFPDTGRTGSQPDFGALKLWPEMRTKSRRRLGVIQFDVYQEACRPTWFREADVSPWRHADHPGVWMWYQRPFNRAGVNCPDTLGKTAGQENTDAPVGYGSTERWGGYRKEHYSQNHFLTYAMVTADRWALQVYVPAQIHLWLGMAPINSGNATINGNEAPRGVGRFFHTGSTLCLLAADLELYNRMRDRMAGPVHVENVLARWVGTAFPNNPLQPLEVSGSLETRETTMDNTVQAVKWWQEGLAMLGIYAYFRLTGDQRIYPMLRKIALDHTYEAWHYAIERSEQLLDSIRQAPVEAWPEVPFAVVGQSSGATGTCWSVLYNERNAYANARHMVIRDATGTFQAGELLTCAGTPDYARVFSTWNSEWVAYKNKWWNGGQPMSLPTTQIAHAPSWVQSWARPPRYWDLYAPFGLWNANVPALACVIATVEGNSAWLARAQTIRNTMRLTPNPGNGTWPGLPGDTTEEWMAVDQGAWA